MLGRLKFQYRKAVQALNFLARANGGRIGKLRALKLVYLADRYHLRKYGRPITNDQYIAMEYGPVASSVKDIAELSDFLGREERRYAVRFLAPAYTHQVKSLAAVDSDVLSESDRAALQVTWRRFGRNGRADGFDLARLTHCYPEWLKHSEALQVGSRVRMDWEDFLDNAPQGVPETCRLTRREQDLRREQVRELLEVDAFWS